MDSIKYVSVIIPVLNEWFLTKDCISRLTAAELRTDYEIVVIDNGSSDETRDGLTEIQQANSNLKVVRNSTNQGYARACNQGASIASGKFLCFLNNDVQTTMNTIFDLAHKLQKLSTTAAVMPIIFDETGKVDSVGSFLTSTGVLYHPYIGSNWDAPTEECIEVDSLKGAMMIWKTEIFHKLGGFDESYFAYCEETELGFRARSTGFSLLCFPQNSAIHLGSRSGNEWRRKHLDYVGTRNWAMTICRHINGRDFPRIFISYLFIKIGFISFLILVNPTRALRQLRGLFTGVSRGFSTRKPHGILQVSFVKVPLSYYSLAISRSVSKVWPLPKAKENYD